MKTFIFTFLLSVSAFANNNGPGDVGSAKPKSQIGVKCQRENGGGFYVIADEIITEGNRIQIYTYDAATNSHTLKIEAKTENCSIGLHEEGISVIEE